MRCISPRLVALLLLSQWLASVTAFGNGVSDDCDEGGPRQCSARLSHFVREIAADDWIVPLVGSFNTLFRHACRRHDACYRFGYRTYGFSRSHCDQEFRSVAIDACQSDERLVILVAGGGILPFALCEEAAELYYQGLRRLGSDSFKTDNGWCCPYLNLRPATGSTCTAGSNTVVPAASILFILR